MELQWLVGALVDDDYDAVYVDGDGLLDGVADLAGEFVGSTHAFFQGDVFFFGDQELGAVASELEVLAKEALGHTPAAGENALGLEMLPRLRTHAFAIQLDTVKDEDTDFRPAQGDNKTIIASKYELYLPSAEQQMDEVEEARLDFDRQQQEKDGE